jgi:DNA-nicking Smr family endonuclease
MTLKAQNLSDLAALKKTLADTRRQVLQAEQSAREDQARAHRECHLFALTVGEVQPLRQPPTAPLNRPRPAPHPRQRELDEAAVMLEAISDDFDAQWLLETDDTLSFRQSGVGPEVVRKLRRGVWTIEAQLDLHGARRDEAREQLNHFIHQAQARGLRCVRVVHGKGHGSPGREPVLKGKVKSWLVQKKEVLAFTQARPAQGGAGALVVLLSAMRAQKIACQ